MPGIQTAVPEWADGQREDTGVQTKGIQAILYQLHAILANIWQRSVSSSQITQVSVTHWLKIKLDETKNNSGRVP